MQVNQQQQQKVVELTPEGQTFDMFYNPAAKNRQESASFLFFSVLLRIFIFPAPNVSQQDLFSLSP